MVNDADSFQNFCDIGLEKLNKHAPCEQKYVRNNQMSFLRNFLRQLRQDPDCGTTTKNRNDKNRLLYIKQRNNCV